MITERLRGVWILWDWDLRKKNIRGRRAERERTSREKEEGVGRVFSNPSLVGAHMTHWADGDLGWGSQGLGLYLGVSPPTIMLVWFLTSLVPKKMDLNAGPKTKKRS